MDTRHRTVLSAFQALAVVVLVVFEDPRLDIAGTDPEDEKPRKTRICDEHGRVVPEEDGTCPHCGAELKDR